MAFRYFGVPHRIPRPVNFAGRRRTRLPSMNILCDSTGCWKIPPNRSNKMEERKLAIIAKMEEKGVTVANAAETIAFNPMILGLYLVKDAYPVPKRILDKLETALAN